MAIAAQTFSFGVVAATPASWHDSCVTRLAAVGARCVVNIAGGQRIDVAASSKLGLDFVLSFDAGDPSPDLAALGRFGVWHFRYGDGERYVSNPPCFWEVYDGCAVAGARLVRTDASGTHVLKSGYIATSLRSVDSTLASLQDEISRWPAHALSSLRRGMDSVSSTSDAVAATKARSTPRAAARISLACKLLGRRVAAVRDWFFVDKWNVGFADARVEDFLHLNVPPPVSWFPETNDNRYLADPFGIEVGGRSFVFVEDLNMRKNLGSIACIELENGAWSSDVRTAIALPTHMSYPYLIEDNGEIYCIPETCEAGTVDLFRAANFPLQWIKAATLIPNFAGVDSTPLRRDGRWWMFTGDRNDGSKHKLYLFYADRLEGPWTPHARNPVKIDPRSSRGAGPIFEHAGALYRPAQDCSRTYGGGLVINRIINLSPSIYAEETVASFEPRPGEKFSSGIHTLTAFGNVTLVDGKRRMFTLRKVRYALTRPLSRLKKRLSA